MKAKIIDAHFNNVLRTYNKSSFKIKDLNTTDKMGIFLLNRSLYLPFLNNEIVLKINWISYAFIAGFLSLRGQTKATLPLPNPSPTPPLPN